MTKRWTYYAMPGVGFLLYIVAFSPMWLELSRGKRIRLTLLVIVYWAVVTYLMERYVDPLMYGYFEKIRERRERKKAARDL